MQSSSKVTTSGLRVRSRLLVVSLLAELATIPGAFSQVISPAQTSVQFILAGLYVNPIVPGLEAMEKDPVPCVPCDGWRGRATVFVDVSALWPFSEDWQLQGIYLTVGDETYWFDKSTDPDILSKYSRAAFTTVVIKDEYEITSGEAELGLHFDFLNGARHRWIKSRIDF